MYALVSCGVVALYVTNWLPFSYFFIKYIIISILLAVVLYFAFWMYKAGYRKQALLMAIVGVALAAISIIVLKWAYDWLHGEFASPLPVSVSL
ncbi:MAG: hypothetical protein K2G85_06935 [Muribaculaceae bacterium]|nr:hypothetical protein [Muribaculaceae bacterium]